MEGCKRCLSQVLCIKCDGQYLLTESSCKMPLTADKYHYVQSSPGIVLQFKVPHNSTLYPEIRNVKAALGKIVALINDTSAPSQVVPLNVNRFYVPMKGIMTVYIDHPYY